MATHPFKAPARAKINLFLDILERRPDGYHSLETVMGPAWPVDAITLSLSDCLGDEGRAFTLECSDPALPTDDNNLALRAARALREAFPEMSGAHIRIEKQIPIGAGLGGGSADAAAVLRLLNQAAGLGASLEKLAEIAARFGSDTPYHVYDAPMFAEGRGERLRPVQCRLEEGGFVVLCPEAAVSTPEAYRWWDEAGMPRTSARAGDCMAALERGDWAAAIETSENAFQAVVEERVPEIARARQALLDAGCLKAVLSGSGASVFGLSPTYREAQEAARRLTKQGCRAFACSMAAWR